MTYALALDLKNDESLMAEYERYHRQIPEPVRQSLLESGILSMEIYRWQNRLFMRMVTSDEFSWERKRQADMTSPEVQAWEKLMWRFQQALPGTPPGEKWQRMTRIFDLNA